MIHFSGPESPNLSVRLLIEYLEEAILKYRALMEFSLEDFVHGSGQDDDYQPRDIGEAWDHFSEGLLDRAIVNAIDTYHEQFEFYVRGLVKADAISEEVRDRLLKEFKSLYDYPCNLESYQKWHRNMFDLLYSVFKEGAMSKVYWFKVDSLVHYTDDIPIVASSEEEAWKKLQAGEFDPPEHKEPTGDDVDLYTSWNTDKTSTYLTFFMEPAGLASVEDAQ